MTDPSWTRRPEEADQTDLYDWGTRAWYPRPRRILVILAVLAIIAASVLALLWAADRGEHQRCEKLISQHAAQWRIERACPTDYN